MTQVVRSAEEKAASKARKEAKKAAAKTSEKRKRGRPKGSKNKSRKEVELNPELVRIQTALKSLLETIGNYLSLVYVVMDGHFGNYPSAYMVRETGLHLISKMRSDAALYLPFEGEHKKRGPKPKQGDKIDVRALPDKYLKETNTEDDLRTEIYQGQFINKEFDFPLNVVIIVRTNLKTSAQAHVILFSTDLEQTYDQIIKFYSLRFQIEMVFMQMTKTDMFAGGVGWENISDFDISVRDDYSIDEQFYQFSFLFKTGILQSRSDAAAKIIDRSRQTSQFTLPVYLLNKLLLLSFQPLVFTIQVCSTLLIFRQRDNTT